MLYLYIMKELVYFIKHRDLAPVKIGKSAIHSFDNRMGSFRNSSPCGIQVLGIIKVEDAFALEQKLHKRFADKRLNGEWFDITKEDVDRMVRHYGDKDLMEAVNQFIFNYTKVDGGMGDDELKTLKRSKFISKILKIPKDKILNMGALVELSGKEFSKREVREICESMGYVYKHYQVRGEYFRGFKF